MRRKDREIKDFEKMISILDSCDCCRIGLVDGDEAYIVPLNFGYEQQNENLVLYFHSAKEGRKIDLINNQKSVSFQMDTKHKLVGGEAACDYTYFYQCIMGNGCISMIQDREEKIHGLNQIMGHYSENKNWEYKEAMLAHVAVMKLEVTKWSCKEH